AYRVLAPQPNRRVWAEEREAAAMKQTATKKTVCPQCGMGLKFRDEQTGKLARCPHCDHRFRLGAKTVQGESRPAKKKSRPAQAASQRPVWIWASVGGVLFLAAAALGGALLWKKGQNSEAGAVAATPTPPPPTPVAPLPFPQPANPSPPPAATPAADPTSYG